MADQDGNSPGVLRDRLEQHERDIAENKHSIANARQILELKMDRLAADIGDLKNALKWAGGIVISLMISFMGWAALQQFNANEAQKAEIEKQLEIIQKQDEGKKDREAILRELGIGPGGAEATVTPISDGKAVNDN